MLMLLMFNLDIKQVPCGAVNLLVTAITGVCNKWRDLQQLTQHELKHKLVLVNLKTFQKDFSEKF